MVGAAREGVVLDRAAPAFQPNLETGPSRFEQLELNRPTGLLLGHRGPRHDPAAADQLTDPDFHDVAAAQLAVDGEV
jgi:hypothetical protein